MLTVAPLVLVGTKERHGWDFAPKHLAMPLGWEGFYCFAFTPWHATYRQREGTLVGRGSELAKLDGPDLYE